MNPEPNWDEIGMTLMQESWTYREAEHGVTRAKELFASGVSLEGAMERVRYEHDNKDMEVAQEDGAMVATPIQWDEPNPREEPAIPAAPRTVIPPTENVWDVGRWPVISDEVRTNLDEISRPVDRQRAHNGRYVFHGAVLQLHHVMSRWRDYARELMFHAGLTPIQAAKAAGRVEDYLAAVPGNTEQGSRLLGMLQADRLAGWFEWDDQLITTVLARLGLLKRHWASWPTAEIEKTVRMMTERDRLPADVAEAQLEAYAQGRRGREIQALRGGRRPLMSETHAPLYLAALLKYPERIRDELHYCHGFSGPEAWHGVQLLRKEIEYDQMQQVTTSDCLQWLLGRKERGQLTTYGNPGEAWYDAHQETDWDPRCMALTERPNALMEAAARSAGEATPRRPFALSSEQRLRADYILAGDRRLVVQREREYFVKGGWAVRLTKGTIPKVEVVRADERWYGPDRIHFDLDEDLATCLLAALQEGGRRGDRS